MPSGKVTAILTAALMALGACASDSGGGSSDSSDESSEPITIGIVAERSGALAAFGESMERSAQLAIKEINADGGINGREIEVLVEDSASEVAVTVDKVNKLMRQDQVDLIMGPIGSDENAAGAKVAAENGEALYFNSEGYEGGVCYPTYFAFSNTPGTLRSTVPLLVDELGSNVYLFGADYVWPRNVFEKTKDALDESGGNVAGELYLPIVTDDFSQLVNDVRSSDPDWLYALYPAIFDASLKALNDAGLLDDMDLANGFVGDQNLPSVARFADGMYSVLSYSTALDTPEATEWLQRFQAEYGADAVPGGNESVSAYNAVYLYKQAVEEAGNTEPDAVAEALVGQSFDGPTGTVEMTESHHLNQPVFVFKVVDSEYELVEEFQNLDPDEPACS